MKTLLLGLCGVLLAITQTAQGADAKVGMEAKVRSELADASTPAIGQTQSGSSATLNKPVGTVPGSPWTSPSGIDFVYIRPGTFIMGSPGSESGPDDKDETQHRVTLTKGYWLGKYEVTQGQWQAVMGTTLQQQRDKAYPSWPLAGEGRDHPTYYVSWEDCQEFIKKLCEKEGVPQGTYRLPTEAEWEYACRAGTTGPFHYGDSLDASQANFDGNFPYGSGMEGEYRQKTTPAGSFRPNSWGLYDMHGNIWEWCQDWYGQYPTKSVADPAGPGSGSFRVLRGGCWNNDAMGCRSADRVKAEPGFRYYYVGFRLLRTE